MGVGFEPPMVGFFGIGLEGGASPESLGLGRGRIFDPPPAGFGGIRVTGGQTGSGIGVPGGESALTGDWGGGAGAALAGVGVGGEGAVGTLGVEADSVRALAGTFTVS